MKSVLGAAFLALLQPQEPPSSGRSQLSFTQPWGTGKLVPEEALLQALQGGEVR